jgi:acylphosphatase
MANGRRIETVKPRADGVRREVRYAGRVQGVGFRYTTLRLAGNYRVMGFVRNLADGRVELIVEGAAGEVDEFLADVEAALGPYIHSADARPAAATGEFGQFEIRA